MSRFDVGARLKEVRVLAGFSQRVLADRAGVPHGQISLLETNRNNPSVASLTKILNGIPISLSQNFLNLRTKTPKTYFLMPLNSLI